MKPLSLYVTTIENDDRTKHTGRIIAEIDRTFATLWETKLSYSLKEDAEYWAVSSFALYLLEASASDSVRH